MPQNTSPSYVPGADEGTAEGLAAPGRAGAGGTNSSVSVLAIVGELGLLLFMLLGCLLILGVNCYFLGLVLRALLVRLFGWGL
ncbi:hypothetical protein [Comamonas terrae]|uniref:Uncharacterized protein n=1 Tax=Comamonas terrae TaxID=673548 RepID=A0ABW5URX7_9BURK|nr:hypothetical protein [Comamonas terrae]